MTFDIITIFPNFFESPLREGVLGRAIKKGLINVRIINLRDFTTDRHRTTDDRPYGGGPGMVMIPGPLKEAITHAKKDDKDATVILLSPRGEVFDHEISRELSKKEHFILICGRYEGVDERIVKAFVDMELSIGDFVLSGGEPAALVIIDAISRLVPGVLGKEESAKEDSFATGLLEYPHYTRPREFMGMAVPDVLLSGDHKKIEGWRRKEALKITFERRPDLLKRVELSEEDKAFLEELKRKNR